MLWSRQVHHFLASRNGSRSNQFLRQVVPFESLDTPELVTCPSHIGRRNNSLLNILFDSCPFPFLWLPIAASAGSPDFDHVSLQQNKRDLHRQSHFASLSHRPPVEVDLGPCAGPASQEPPWAISASVRKNCYGDIIG